MPDALIELATHYSRLALSSLHEKPTENAVYNADITFTQSCSISSRAMKTAAMWAAALLLVSFIAQISYACYHQYSDNMVVCTVEELSRLSGPVERRMYTLYLYSNIKKNPKTVLTPQIIAALGRIYPELNAFAFNSKKCSNKPAAFPPFTRIICHEYESLAYDDILTTTAAVAPQISPAVAMNVILPEPTETTTTMQQTIPTTTLRLTTVKSTTTSTESPLPSSNTDAFTTLSMILQEPPISDRMGVPQMPAIKTNNTKRTQRRRRPNRDDRYPNDFSVEFERLLNKSIQGTVWLKPPALDDPQLRAELRLIQTSLRRIAAKIDNLNISEEIRQITENSRASLKFLYANLTSSSEDSAKITEEIRNSAKMNQIMIERLFANLTSDQESDLNSGNLTITPAMWTSKYFPDGLSEQHLLFALAALSALTLTMTGLFIACAGYYCCGRRRRCCCRRRKKAWERNIYEMLNRNLPPPPRSYATTKSEPRSGKC